MEYVFEGMKPERLWFYFNEILKIPRPSKKEEKIAAYLEEFGKLQKLETFKDNAGNILIRKRASKGMENCKTVILQSHIDMVCEKNSDVDFDFMKDTIRAWSDGEWIRAKGTTLGADDGIGIATQLAILESNDIAHGPIECLFTVDEETGLSGAFGLGKDFLKGKILLNLDSEDEGEIFIGCAGGKDTLARIAFKKEDLLTGTSYYKIRVGGLKGGHSGDDIEKGLGNANKILNRILWNSSKMHQIRLAFIDGGNLRNAIAREAFAVVTVQESISQKLLDYVNAFNQTVKEELKITEPDLFVEIVEAEKPEFLIDFETHQKLLCALYACPHGVISWSASIPNFVETSTNLASVKMQEDEIFITTSQRSSVESAKKDVCDMVASVFYLSGAAVEHSDGYPGWSPDPKSEILKISEIEYEKLFNQKPKVLAVHAGLECGLIGKKYPGMDMISYGPTIKGAHSPDERLKIDTVKMFWDFTLNILKNIPEA